ncbi:MAG TPA: hypothetical protein VEZ11_05000 [Thermoanaerobaculia bacterium]|nr:hypothetical protein [Thermoanaerobaculia bacterium]
MTILQKGSFELNLGIIKLGADLSELDRQCAWELYTELSTRVACTGKSSDSEATNFDGELYIESLESLYRFFQESRGIMRKFPVGRLTKADKNHFGVIISSMITGVLRPFLELWQAEYRHWWDAQSNPRVPPLQRQREFPKLADFLNDWTAVRLLLRGLQARLVEVYDLVEVDRR